MMRNYFKIILVMCLMNIGCSAQKNLLVTDINASGNKENIEDSMLRKLQSENDLVIAYAVENFAWVKSMDFHIVTQKNNQWKGYRYHRNLMPNASGSPTKISEEKINAAICDSLLDFIEKNKAWNIKGDSGEVFCTDGNKNCNINDATSLQLWIITKDASVDPSYYAPDFYQQCCPDEQRGLFLSITKKIASAFDDDDLQ